MASVAGRARRKSTRSHVLPFRPRRFFQRLIDCVNAGALLNELPAAPELLERFTFAAQLADRVGEKKTGGLPPGDQLCRKRQMPQRLSVATLLVIDCR